MENEDLFFDEKQTWAPVGCLSDVAIGKKILLPDEVVQSIVKSIPPESYTPSWKLAFAELSLAAVLAVVGTFAVMKLPWFLLPVGWAGLGFAVSHFYMIAHDCAHGTWSSSPRLNRVVGQLCLLPLLRSFASMLSDHVLPSTSKFFWNLDSKHSFTPSVATLSAASTATATSSSVPSSYPGSKHKHQQFGHVHASDLSVMGAGLIVAGVVYKFGFSLGLWHLARFWLLPVWLHALFLHSLSLRIWRRSLPSKRASKPDQEEREVDVGLVFLPPALAGTIASYRLPQVANAIRRALKEFPESIQILKAAATPLIPPALPGHDDMAASHAHGDQTGIPADMLDGDKLLGLKKLSPSWFIYWMKRINWVHAIILTGTPIMAIYGLFTREYVFNTFVWAFCYYVITGLGITAGYHRLFAHRAFRASPLVRLLLLAAGTGALEGSCEWWCGGHRIHHRYTDTRYDPYNAKRGLFYSHIGWMMVHPQRKHALRADISDLKADFFIRMQHRFYFFFGPFFAFIFPALVAHFGWNDFWGGLYFAGALRLFVVHHNTFCVNSIAHALGDQGYDDQRTPRDSIITALLTFGEGYHCFHHEFPSDYRNGIRVYDYDPTKWLIRLFYALGLVFDLKEFPHNEIRKGQLAMQSKKLLMEKHSLRWPVPISKLPPMTWSEIDEQCKAGKKLVVIEGLVHDVAEFMDEHPGGRAILAGAIGTDATKRFHGDTGVYKHSRAANNLLSNFRCARLIQN